MGTLIRRFLTIVLAISVANTQGWCQAILATRLQPRDSSVPFLPEALIQRAVWLGGLWKSFRHGSRQRALAVQMVTEEAVLFRGLPESEELQRENLIGQIRDRGVDLWGARWTSFDYLQDYLDLRRALPPGAASQRPRRVFLIPWQIIPLAYFIWWPVVPFMSYGMVLVLPNRSSFRWLAAFDLSQDYLKRNPKEITRFGTRLSEASAAMAAELLGEPLGQDLPISNSRFTAPFLALLGTVVAGYLWFGSSMLSDWQNEVVASPIVPALIVTGFIVWILGFLKPGSVSLWHAHHSQDSSAKKRRLEFQIGYRLPIAFMTIMFLLNSISFSPNRQSIQFDPPRPFGRIDRIVRAYRQAQRARHKAEPSKITHRVTPLIFPRDLRPVKKRKPKPVSSEPAAPEPEPPLISQAPQTPTVIAPPTSPDNRPYVPFFRLVTRMENINEGDYAALHNRLEEMGPKISIEVRQRLLREFEQRFQAGGWTMDQTLRLRVAVEPDDETSWELTYLGLPERDPANMTPEAFARGAVTIDFESADQKIWRGFSPSFFTDAMGHALTDSDFNLGRARVGDTIFLANDMFGLKKRDSVKVVDVKNNPTPPQDHQLVPRQILPLVFLFAMIPSVLFHHHLAGFGNFYQAGALGFLAWLDHWLFPHTIPAKMNVRFSTAA